MRSRCALTGIVFAQSVTRTGDKYFRQRINVKIISDLIKNTIYVLQMLKKKNEEKGMSRADVFNRVKDVLSIMCRVFHDLRRKFRKIFLWSF
jgi:hypothetical protein